MKTLDKPVNQQRENGKTPHISVNLSYTINFGEEGELIYDYSNKNGETNVVLQGFVKDFFYRAKFIANTEDVSKDFVEETVKFISKKGVDCCFNPYYSTTKECLLYFNNNDYEVKKFYLGEREDDYEDYDDIVFVNYYNKQLPPITSNKILLKNRSGEISEIKLDLQTLKNVFEDVVNSSLNDYMCDQFFFENGCYDDDILKYIYMISFFNMVHHFMNNVVDKDNIIKALNGEKLPPAMEWYDFNINIFCYDDEDDDESSFNDDEDDDEYTFKSFTSDGYDYKSALVMMKFDYENQMLYIYPYVKLDGCFLDHQDEEKAVKQIGDPDYYDHCLFNEAAKVGAYLSIQDNKLVLNISKDMLS